MKIITTSLLAVISLTAVSAFDIWAAPMQVNWPTVMAVLIPPDVKLSNSPTYAWSFPTDSKNPSCTTKGMMNVSPCQGLVVDHSFSTAGQHTISLTITDSNLPSPISVSVVIAVAANLANMPQVGRAEIRQLDATAWNRTTSGLYRLMDIGVYTHMARIHRAVFSNNLSTNTTRNAAHSAPAFAPWHRSAMRVIEVCMQTILNDPNYGMPYLDWRLGYTGLDTYLGGNGNGANSWVVEDGPFCANPSASISQSCPKRWVLPDDFPDSIKAIKRQQGNNANYHFQTDAEFNALMNAPAYDEAPFSDSPTQNSFRNALEGWAGGKYGKTHNGFHLWCGGTMSQVSVSFYDPTFLFHHSQVDRLFTMWQKKNNCQDGKGNAVCYRPGDTDPDVNANLIGVANRTKPDGTSQYVIDGSMYSDAMFPWGLKVSDVLVAELGYKFLEAGVKPAPIPVQPPSNATKIDGIVPGNGVLSTTKHATSSATSTTASLAFAVLFSITLSLL